MIDIDDALMAEAKRIFGTTTKKETVERALTEAIARQRRLDYVKAQRSNPDWKPAAYQRLMRQAWK